MTTFDWIDSDADLVPLIEKLAATPAWALDTEFHREKTYTPRLALVQVASPHGISLIDPFRVDITRIRAAFDDAVVILHAADQDLEILDIHVGRRPARIFDTQVAAGFLGMESPSLANLVGRFLGLQLPKGDRLTDWTARPLTGDQLIYAASDVEHLVPLHEVLTERLQAEKRLQWAFDECDHLLGRERPVRVPEETWWRLKGSRSLRGRAQSIAQAVCAWREREAESLDLQPRMVLSDLAILAIAQNPPSDRAGLLALRGVDGRHLRKGADRRILAAIEQGKALPADALRQPPSGEPEGRLKPVIATVMGWISQRAVDLDLNPSLLATRTDVRDLLQYGNGRLTDGWREEVVGRPILRFAAGDAHLAVERDRVRLV